MANREESNYYEIQLDNKQLIFIFLIAIVICGVFFLIGVKVGKSAKELEYSVTKADLTPKKQEPLPEPEEGKEALEQSKDLSFYQLTEKTPEEKKVEPQPPTSQEVKKKEEAKISEKKPPKETPVLPKTTEEKKEVPSELRYSVQVMASSDRVKVLAMRDRLKAKNYPAFVLPIEDSQGNIVYKVRVGSFSDKAKASQMLQSLKLKEKITDAWITSNRQ